jgi:uncharacterized membrane protein
MVFLILRMWFLRTRSDKAELAILLFFMIWFLLTILAPFTLPANSVKDLSGTTGSIDNEDVIEEMNPLAGAIYTVGDAYCHQISGRSHYLNGNQMPFCSRDEGLFLGLAIGMAVAIVTRYEISALGLILGIAPIAIDGLAQILTDYESTNPLRVITGLLAGIVISLLISLFIREFMEEKDLEGSEGQSELPKDE